MDSKRFIALSARMEGESVLIRNIGRKIKVSQMELVCLCNFAKLGLLAVFSELDGEEGYKAASEIDLLVEAIRETFANEANRNGLARLAQSCVAILSDERLEQYIVPTPKETIYVCPCGWSGELEALDALGSESGCCPLCGNENLDEKGGD